jgi:hypothetical protein
MRLPARGERIHAAIDRPDMRARNAGLTAARGLGHTAARPAGFPVPPCFQGQAEAVGA